MQKILEKELLELEKVQKNYLKVKQVVFNMLCILLLIIYILCFIFYKKNKTFEMFYITSSILIILSIFAEIIRNLIYKFAYIIKPIVKVDNYKFIIIFTILQILFYKFIPFFIILYLILLINYFEENLANNLYKKMINSNILKRIISYYFEETTYTPFEKIYYNEIENSDFVNKNILENYYGDQLIKINNSDLLVLIGNAFFIKNNVSFNFMIFYIPKSLNCKIYFKEKNTLLSNLEELEDINKNCKVYTDKKDIAKKVLNDKVKNIIFNNILQRVHDITIYKDRVYIGYTDDVSFLKEIPLDVEMSKALENYKTKYNYLNKIVREVNKLIKILCNE